MINEDFDSVELFDEDIIGKKPNQSGTESEQFLLVREISEMTGYSSEHLIRLFKGGAFPPDTFVWRGNKWWVRSDRVCFIEQHQRVARGGTPAEINNVGITDPIGTAEIAEILGVSIARAGVLCRRKRNVLPTVVRLANGRYVASRMAIEEFVQSKGREDCTDVGIPDPIEIREIAEILDVSITKARRICGQNRDKISIQQIAKERGYVASRADVVAFAAELNR